MSSPSVVNAVGSSTSGSSPGSVTSEYMNEQIQRVCAKKGIPFQLSPVGRDTGTDAMAGVLGSIDAAAVSVGIPIRNMHTISESGHTGDVLACLHGLYETLGSLDKANGGKGLSRGNLQNGHARLDLA